MFGCENIFNDRRIVTWMLAGWTVLTASTFYAIMAAENSPFLVFGPNQHSKLFGVKLDSWFKWWCVTIYTFVSTFVAAFASDSIVPFITNTIQDHKTVFIPYKKSTCLLIIQVFTCYSVVISIVGLFVALTQIDFTIVRLVADLMVNHITTFYFLRGKVTDVQKYDAWNKRAAMNTHTPLHDDTEIELELEESNPITCDADTTTLNQI